MPFLIILAVVILVIIVANIKIVPQAHEFVIEFLGNIKQPGVQVFTSRFRFLKELQRK